MKFIQRMLSHGLLIAIVVVAGLAYWYRADLFPERFGPQVRTVAGKTVTQPGQGTATASNPMVEPAAPVEEPVAVADPMASTPAEPPPAVADLPPMQGSAATAVESGQALRSMAQPQFRPVEDEAVMQQPENTGELPPLAGSDAGMPEAEPEPLAHAQLPEQAPHADVAANTAPVNDAPVTSTATGQESLAPAPEQAARAAFWQQDFGAAEQYYLQLAEQEPNNPDAYGELGNLYYQLGRWQQAADAYSRAAQRLLDQGDVYPAQQLLRVLWNLDQDQARELETKLNAAISTR